MISEEVMVPEEKEASPKRVRREKKERRKRVVAKQNETVMDLRYYRGSQEIAPFRYCHPLRA